MGATAVFDWRLLTNIEEEIQQTRKIFDAWICDQYNFLGATNDACQTGPKKREAHVAQLKEKEAELRNKIERVSLRKQQSEHEAEVLQHELQQLVQRRDHLVAQITRAEEALAKEIALLAIAKQDIPALENQIQEIAKEQEKNQHFKKHLGMSILRLGGLLLFLFITLFNSIPSIFFSILYFSIMFCSRLCNSKEEELQFTFTNIDANDPSREFSFVVLLDNQDYRVSRCNPVIPQMQTLLRSLNATNNFIVFLCDARACFVELSNQ